MSPERLDAARAELASTLTQAVASDRRADFDETFTRSTPIARLDLLWNNLRQLGAVRFESADAAGFRVAWRVPGDLHDAWQLLDVQLACNAHRCEVADLTPRLGSPAPLWLVEQIKVVTVTGGSVIAGLGARDWTQATTQAVAALQAAQLGELAAGWSGELVLVAPASEEGYRAVMGATGDEYAAAGAITWTVDHGLPEADRAGVSNTATIAAVRVVANPTTTAALGPAAANLLLTHEAVHVATAHLGLPAAGRRWISEGLAEVVALQSSPDQVALHKGLLKSDCAQLVEPPADDSFAVASSSGERHGELVYAAAWEYVSTVERLRAAGPSRALLATWWVGQEVPDLTPASVGQAAVRECKRWR